MGSGGSRSRQHRATRRTSLCHPRASLASLAPMLRDCHDCPQNHLGGRAEDNSPMQEFPETSSVTLQLSKCVSARRDSPLNTTRTKATLTDCRAHVLRTTVASRCAGRRSAVGGDRHERALKQMHRSQARRALRMSSAEAPTPHRKRKRRRASTGHEILGNISLHGPKGRGHTRKRKACAPL